MPGSLLNNALDVEIKILLESESALVRVVEDGGEHNLTCMQDDQGQVR